MKPIDIGVLVGLAFLAGILTGMWGAIRCCDKAEHFARREK